MTEPTGPAQPTPGDRSSDVIERAEAAIDELNARDPELILDPTNPTAAPAPKAVVHAARMVAWLERLDPEASIARRLAARAHHLGRWALPRAEYPAGRAGYLRWRTEQKKRQAATTGEVLAAAGVDPTTVARVQQLVAKVGLGTDADVQAHEDALCLVFLEQEFSTLTDQLGDDHMVEVLRKTAAKMSADGLAAVADIGLDERGQRLVAAALGPGDSST